MAGRRHLGVKQKKKVPPIKNGNEKKGDILKKRHEREDRG